MSEVQMDLGDSCPAYYEEWEGSKHERKEEQNKQ